MKERRTQPRGYARGYLIAFLVFLALVVLSFFGAFRVSEILNHDNMSHFEAAVEESLVLLQNRLEDYEGLLHNLRALFAASEVVDRDEWLAFTQSLNIEERLPGVRAVEYIRHITDAEKAVFELDIQQATNTHIGARPGFFISPEGEREAYAVVDYIYPFEKNETVFGFDLASNPERKTALDKATRLNAVVATPPINLVQDQDNSSPGFLMMLPVYTNGASISTEADRQEALEGHVLAVFHASDLITSALADLQIEQDFYLRASAFSDEGVEQVLFLSGNGNRVQSGAHVVDRKVRVADRVWDFSFSEKTLFSTNRREIVTPVILFLSGFLIATLVGFLLASFARTRSKAMELATEQTIEIKKAKERAEKARKEAEKAQEAAERALLVAEEERQKTAEKVFELEQTSKAMVGRELKMLQLKEELNKKKKT